jgi:aspartyl-tRNA(Asn)/glutamyl-tRNA(Gln) amidotransferase subunit A
MDISSLTIDRVRQALLSREISASELAAAALRFAEAENPKTNAYLRLCPERAMAAAQRVDERIARGEDPGPLCGVPIAVKDVIVTKGVKTTCGSRLLAEYIPPYDATAIIRIEEAGGVILGKTNCDEFAMGSSNENSFFGPVRNPWDFKAVPGGSSGGSAAAVAAGLAPGATGTDTGGSIRQPASFTGTCGLRPTYGRVSRYGMVAFASSLDQGGALAHSAEDLALLLDVMAGFDARDSTCVDRPTGDYAASLKAKQAPLRIGLPREYFTAELADDVAKPILEAVEELKRLGCETVEVSLPNQRLSVPVYYVLAPAEASSNLSRFDGVRYGHRAERYTDLMDMYRKTRAEGFGAEVKRRILIGTYVLSHGYYDSYYLQAQRIRRLIARDFAEAFRQCDLIVGPAAPSVAFDLAAKRDDPVQMYLDDLYTIPINLAGLPGMSIPCGFGDKGRPVGLQIVGNYFDEARMLSAAHMFQRVTDWHSRMPPAFV